MMRATASMMPVMMPDRAVGSTIFTIVFHFGTPRAYAASRRSIGTMRSISSVLRTITGTISSTSARDTANPERSNPNMLIHRA